MNNIQIIGNSCKDPEAKILDNGTKITTINLASNIYKKGENTTMFFRVSIFGNQYDKFLEYVKKGSSLVVTGQLQEVRTYEAKDGAWKASLDVIANSISFNPSSSKKEDSDASYGTEIEEGSYRSKAVPMDEELPF